MNSNIKKMKNQKLVVFVLFALALDTLSIGDTYGLGQNRKLLQVPRASSRSIKESSHGKKFFIFIFNKRMSYLVSGFFIQLVNF